LGKISRRELKTGMVIHISGKGLMSRFLRRLFKSKYIHSAIIVVLKGIPFVMEVTGGRKRKGFKSGWQLVALDNYVGKGLKRWVSCVQVCPLLNNADQEELEKIALKTLEAHTNTVRSDDINYGYLKALSVVFRRIKGRNPVCSDYVREVFRGFGIGIRPDLEMILPPQLQESKELLSIAEGIE